MSFTKTCIAKTTFAMSVPNLYKYPFKTFLVLPLLFAFSFCLQAQRTSVIKLRSGIKIAETNFQSEKIKTHLRKSVYNRNSYTIVQFNKLPDAAQVEKLRQAGISLLQYIPDNAYWVLLPEKTATQNFSSFGIKGIYEATTEDKLSPSLYKVWQEALQKNIIQYFSLNISCFKGVIKEDIKKELRQAGAIIINAEYEDQNIFQAKISIQDIEKIAQLPYVSYINKAAEKSTPLLYITNATHNVHALTSTIGAARGLSGNNIFTGMGDDGDPSNHIDLIDRTINRNPNGYIQHSTNVEGVLAGAGIKYEIYKGIAPKATVISQFFDKIITNAPTYYNDYGMTLTNNSYFTGDAGCPGDGEYNELSRYIDSQVRANDVFLHIFAAGNDGALTCSGYPLRYATIKSGWQCSKNTISVGNGLGFLQIIASSSSRGPVSDGRIKPEITAAGNDVRTTFTNNTYNRGFGTSIAAPAVAGVCALLTERYKQLNGNTYPKSSLLKALLCNSADDVGNPGPDFTYGFGWMNAKKAVEDMETGQYILGSISNGQTITHNINVPNNTAVLKVMLYWNDAPADPASLTYLVNDLDLVVKKGGTDYFPWILDPLPAGVTNNATTGADHINNIEQVTVNNPANGNYTLQINGFSVPQGAQDYVITYEFIQSGIELEYPNGGEKMLTDSTETIYWNATDGNNNPFTLEYSADNGSNWVTIDNNIPSTANLYNWGYAGLTPTTQGLMRITRNSTAITDQSDNVFTVLGKPSNLIPSILCQGYVRLSWNAVPSATDYEVFMKQGADMVSIATTAATTFDIDGLSPSQTYWLAVRGRLSGRPGRRSVATSVIPSSGVCTLANFDNDLKLVSVVNPSSGRKFTSTALGAAQTVTVSIKNLDNVVSSNIYTVSYRVNGGAIVTETPGVIMNAQQTINYNFIATYNFLTEGTYNMEAWVSQTGDTRNYNDTATKSVKQLFNDAVTLPFTESFETAAAATYTTATTGLNGLDRCDFSGNNTNSRSRTYVNSDFARTGTKAVTLDATTNFSVTTQSNLITTVNLASYIATQGLRLTLYYRDHQQTTSANNYVWIRGNDTQPWVQAYNLNQTDVITGDYIFVRFININEILTNAGQTVSSSFQIRFGEEGITSANNTTYSVNDNDLDDGYTFDDVSIAIATDDLAMNAITFPGKFNCGLTNATSVTVSVKNTSSTALINVPVSYRINGGSIITESIASVPANTTISYTFSTPADLSVPATYSIDTWVKNPTDDFAPNDSVTGYLVNNNITVNTFPYYEGFENSSGYWYSTPPNSSWQWGTPAKSIINKAANGTKAWVTNLTGNYRNNELSYLYSPCFDLTSLTQPVLSFSHIFRTEDDCDCDYHWIEYSNDGITWQKLGTGGSGTNWFDNFTKDAWQVSRTYWVVSSIDIPTTGSAVRFRFVFSSDPFVSYDGVGIDDIRVFEKASIYTGPENPKEVIQNVSGNGWIDFDFGGNRIASINPRGQDLGSTSVKVFINDTTPVRISNNQYYLDRNIVIKPTNALDSAVKVRFYFTDQESEFLIGAGGCGTCSKPISAYDLGVTKYSYAPEEDGTLYNNTTLNYIFITPSNVDIIPYDNGYFAEYDVTSFSEFWLNNGGPGQNKPLPLQLLNFSARKQNNTSVVEWSTSAEINIEKFIIERKTGAGFVAIGEMAAKGSNSITTKYSFTDNNPAKGSNYYRLRIIEKNGSNSYSVIRKLDYNSKVDLTVYPNPVVDGKATVQSGEVMEKIIITDTKGTIIAQYPVNSRTFIINTKQWAKGVYWIQVYSQKETVTQKLICL